jgi:basic membrane lipoprotein Med (substrate-binding protein (PBP1-ABC) superfamily)
MRKKYFPNSWQAIKDTPSEYFASMSYEQFEDWKIYGYELPDSIHSLVRTIDEDGYIHEFVYNTENGCKNRIKKAMKDNKQIYICTMEGMYFLKPDDLPLDFNNS